MASYTSIFLKRLTVFVSLVLFLYLILPVPRFPIQPHDSVQSLELADTETPWRRAYFTNYTRKEVLNYYQKQLSRAHFFNMPLLTYRLNYPPEEASLLIRDQTRSTFLEEIVQPFRASLFVDGFEPKDPKDDIWYKGVHYRQKIIVKYAPSWLISRLFIIGLGLFLLLKLLRELGSAIREFSKIWFLNQNVYKS